MDKVVSFFTMPVGVMICFGPALVAWLVAEFKSPGDDKQRKNK